MIPQTDPGAAYRVAPAPIDDAVRRVLASGWYILGEEVREFEREFAAYLAGNGGSTIGVANGTDALELAMRGCEIGPGDAVFTVPHTAVATVSAIERAGATPVMVDIDPATFTLDPASLDAALNAYTSRDAKPKAVVPVHLYGHPADLGGVFDVARKHGLIVIEDCAQSHGATYDGQTTGTLGAAAGFSFYPTKNLGAIGDGGATRCSTPEIDERCRMIREYGWKQRYVSLVSGYNSRLDEMQAAILREKLKTLADDNAARVRIAKRYTEAFAELNLTLPIVRGNCKHVFHQYVIRSTSRDALRDALKSRGVGTLIHYPMPIHEQPAYAGKIATPVPLRETERAAREVLSLPMFPQMTDAQIEGVITAVRDAVAGATR